MSVTADAAIERANNLIGFRRLEEARDVITSALASEPEIARLWSTLSTIEKQREDYKPAIVAGERAISIDPTEAVAMHVLVASYELRGKTTKARAMADELVGQYPDWVHGLIQRGFIYSRWYGKVTPSPSDQAKVQASLDRAVELEPENPTTLAYAAVYYAAIWRADVGRPLMTRALELAPTDEEVLLLSKDYADEKGQIERDLAVLADNPLSVMARTGFDEKLWSRVTTFAATPLWTAGVLIIFNHLLYDVDGPVVRVINIVGVALAVLGMVVTARRTRAMFPEGILRSVLTQNRLVVPALAVTALVTVVIAITTLLLSLAPVHREDQFYRDAISALSVSLLVQALATAAIAFTVARVDVSSMRFADTPAGKVALKRQAGNIASAVMGVIGAVFVVILAVITSEVNSLYAAAALAVLCLSWTFSDLGANAYRRSQAYPTLWLAILLYGIAFVIYVIAAMLTFDQVFLAF